MPTLELETIEARYVYDMRGDCHFAIDCACKGKDGKYSGSHYKNTQDSFRRAEKRYEPRDPEAKFQHTFMLNESILNIELRYNHSEERKESPLIIVCNDCEREFPFTLESYRELINRMMDEYSKNINSASPR